MTSGLVPAECTQAGQVTYPMHIILRFEIEKGLIEGSIDVDEAEGRLLGVLRVLASDAFLQELLLRRCLYTLEFAGRRLDQRAVSYGPGPEDLER